MSLAVLPNDPEQLPDVHGLRHVAVEALRQEPLAVPLHRLCGEREYGDRRRPRVRTQPMERLDAVEVRELDVHQHEIGRVLRRHVDRLAARRRLERSVSGRDQDELLARVRSLLRIKRFHDTITAQAAELTELNRTLEERVHTQVVELERVRKLRRFLSPQLVDAIVSSGNDAILHSHRRMVAMLFADLRGFTSFVDAVEPEELMQVLGEFHHVIGSLVQRFDATVGFLQGDGVQLFFNDPIEIPDAALRAVRTGCALREEMAELVPQWSKRGHDLDFGVGIALGYATLGRIGFADRSDYGAVGSVMNMASRLCDERS